MALLSACATLVAAPAAHADHEPADVSSGFFGVNSQFLWPRMHGSLWERHVDSMHTVGVEVARYDARWDQIEPEAPIDGEHSYRWAHYDGVVAHMARRGVRWLPILTFSPPWAGVLQSTPKTPPRDPADFAAFARDFTLRYGRGGSFWRDNPTIPEVPVTAFEIWNEPNGTHSWRPDGPDPEGYADVYAAAREAIHAVDERAEVLVGGLIYPWSWLFLGAMLDHRADLTGNIDGVALHPYGLRGDTVNDVIWRIAHLRYTLQVLGEGDVPLWITEVGWPTKAPPDHPHFLAVAEAERANRMVYLLWRLATSDCGVSAVLPHTWVTPESNAGNVEDWFGIVDPSTADLYPTAHAYGFAAWYVRELERRGKLPPQRHECGDLIDGWTG